MSIQSQFQRAASIVAIRQIFVDYGDPVFIPRKNQIESAICARNISEANRCLHRLSPEIIRAIRGSRCAKTMRRKDRENRVKAYITKYALTEGIFLREVERDSILASDLHLTWRAALKRAKEMRLERIRSLQNQLARIESLEWVKRTENPGHFSDDSVRKSKALRKAHKKTRQING